MFVHLFFSSSSCCSYTSTTSASSGRSCSPTTTTPTSRWPTPRCSSAWVRTVKLKEETECLPPWRWHTFYPGSSRQTPPQHGDDGREREKKLQTLMHFHATSQASVSYLLFSYVYISVFLFMYNMSFVLFRTFFLKTVWIIRGGSELLILFQHRKWTSSPF